MWLFQDNKICLKGQCHEIFCFWFFSWISFPQASDYTIRVVSNFFENSRRYLQLKVCHRCQRHRWQMEKTFKQKNFNNFVRTPLGSTLNIYINFCIQVHNKVSAAWYCCHYLPPVSLIPVTICHRCRWHRWQICRRYTVIRFVWLSAKFGTCTVVSVNGTIVEAKMCALNLESPHFIFNKCPIYTHDGASAKFSTNSQETDYRVSLTPVANLPPVSTTLAKMV